MVHAGGDGREPDRGSHDSIEWQWGEIVSWCHTHPYACYICLWIKWHFYRACRRSPVLIRYKGSVRWLRFSFLCATQPTYAMLYWWRGFTGMTSSSGDELRKNIGRSSIKSTPPGLEG
jgi:hypothetical protein